MKNKDEVLKQIDFQIYMLVSTRAVFPYVPKEFVGEKSYSTAPFYKQYGHSIDFIFSEPLTDNQIDNFDAIGRWINQNFLIRLCAILEYHEIIPKLEKGRINTKLEGHNHVDILRRLRNILAHTSGRYNKDKAEERKLLERISKTYSLENSLSNIDTYPVPIDTLLIPLAEGCKRYIQALAKNT